MKNITYGESIKEAIELEMKRDPMVFLAGEDVAKLGGAFGSTAGLAKEFGPDRVMDTPISETAIIGLAVGSSAVGMRPIVELMYVDFAGVAMDEIMNQAAKMRYMFGGKATLPMVVRAATGATVRGAAQHSQSIEAMFTHVPGLKVVMPATPADAKGLLMASIRDNNPVMFLEHKALYSMKGDVPEGEYVVPLGKANIAKEGTDVTIVAWSLMTQVALQAAKQLEAEGISAEVVDLRSLVPLDKEAIFASIRKTHKLVIVQEAVHTSGFASEIAALVAEECLDELDERIIRVTAPDCPIPYSPVLEDEYVPSPQKVVAAVKSIM